MPPKSKDTDKSTSRNAGSESEKTTSRTTADQSYLIDEFGEDVPVPVGVKLTLFGDYPDYYFLVIFDSATIVEAKWEDNLTLEIPQLPLNLKNPLHKTVAVDVPLILLLRTIGKPCKEPDPLLHPDNVAGANVDLAPLVQSTNEIFVKVCLTVLSTRDPTPCKVNVHAFRIEPRSIEEEPERLSPKDTLFSLTLLSAHCLPPLKDGTVYVGAIGLDGLLNDYALNFGMSLSTPDAKKLRWATASSGGTIAETVMHVPDSDIYIPEDLTPSNKPSCTSVYWNALKRVIVDRDRLVERLNNTFLVDIAAVPRLGKAEVRGRYLGFLDARVLLEPGQIGITSSTCLQFFSDTLIPEDLIPLLDLPSSSAKNTARDPLSDYLIDDSQHYAYLTLRFDVVEPLFAQTKSTSLYLALGFAPSEVPAPIIDELRVETSPDDPVVDTRRIKKECGALAVHKELSTLSCRGAVPMNQGIKRTAANRLLIRVRTMIRQFAPGDCSYLDWQDSVTGQHAAARRAVTASFAPQPPTIRTAARVAASRARLAGDERIARKLVSRDIKAAPDHPRTLIAKILQLLEARSDREARTFIVKALEIQQRSRFLLWVYAGQEYAKGEERTKCARAALRLSVRGDHSDGIANAIGWAGLHSMHHYDNNRPAAFVAMKRARKAHDLNISWTSLLKRWSDASGQEEVYWNPGVIGTGDPLLLTSAFFLCLRCYDFSEKLLQCCISGCGSLGDRLGRTNNPGADIYYLRAASWLLRRQVDQAFEVTEKGIKLTGPSALMLQMRANCLSYKKDWDEQCEAALLESEGAGADCSPKLLLQAALAGMCTDPELALQRAARAHTVAPGAHSALIIGRIYDKLDEPVLAENWAECAVKFEPLLADGWAFLGILAMEQNNATKARMMLRTAYQDGPISPSLQDRIKKLGMVVPVETLPEVLVRGLCFCEYV